MIPSSDGICSEDPSGVFSFSVPVSSAFVSWFCVFISGEGLKDSSSSSGGFSETSSEEY
jgi:hypothetical protein